MINSIEPSVAIKIRRNLQVDICKSTDLVAQSVEHNTFNVGVLGSNPSGITNINKIQWVSAAVGEAGQTVNLLP